MHGKVMEQATGKMATSGTVPPRLQGPLKEAPNIPIPYCL